MLISIDAETGVVDESGPTILRDVGSTSLHGEFKDGRYLISSQSLSSPPELWSIAADGSDPRQLSESPRCVGQAQQPPLTQPLPPQAFFNTERLNQTALGRVEEFMFTGAKGETVQSWLVRPAGFPENDEGAQPGQVPLAVIVHGGPQGAVHDAWNYRWCLQVYRPLERFSANAGAIAPPPPRHRL